MLCDRCKYAGLIKGYPDGDLFDCERGDDSRIPFTMDEDTVCPLYEPRDSPREPKTGNDRDETYNDLVLQNVGGWF